MRISDHRLIKSGLITLGSASFLGVVAINLASRKAPEQVLGAIAPTSAPTPTIDPATLQD